MLVGGARYTFQESLCSAKRIGRLRINLCQGGKGLREFGACQQLVVVPQDGDNEI